MYLFDRTLSKIKHVLEMELHEAGLSPDTDSQDTLEENNPSDGDTFGVLTYKLNCTCIQMWHNQEFLYAVRKMTVDEFIETYGNDLPNLHRMIKRCCDLNNQRAILMDAIDREIAEKANGHPR